MASEKDSVQSLCADDPNFAIICSFLERFAIPCGVTYPTFSELQEMIETPQEVVPQELIDLHVKLLRKIRKSVSAEKWERVLIKFCHSYQCNEEGWELESGGYKNCKVSARLRILKNLCDAQFDLNAKLKTDVNKLTADELRLEPLGKDKVGQAYWCQFDPAANVRVYKEDQDEETWKLVAKDRDTLVGLITQLSSNEELLGMDLMNEDSNSQGIEKPITDTGQVEPATSEENSTDNSSSCDKQQDSCKNNGQLDNQGDNSEEAVVSDVVKSETNGDANLSTSKDKVVDKSGTDNEVDKVPISCNEIKTEELKNGDVKLDSTLDQEKPIKPLVDSSSEKSNQNQVSESSKSDDSADKSCLSNDLPPVEPGEKSSTETDVLPNQTVDKLSTPVNPQSSESTSLSINNPVNSVEVKEELKVENVESSLKDNKRKAEELKEEPSKRACVEKDESNISEAIEEPLMIVKGEGSGNDCDAGNLGRFENSEIGEEIEDPLLLFFGEGSGQECDAVNPGLEAEVGEEIEEPLMIILGEGSGYECETGNPGLEDEDGGVKAKDDVNNVSSNSDDKLTNNSDTNSHIKEKSSLSENILSEKESKGLDDNDKTSQKVIKSPNGDKDEDSIEKQLSVLTGESLTNDDLKDSVSGDKTIQNNKASNCSVERGTRRKSCSEDTETEPPEAKKSKVDAEDSDFEFNPKLKDTEKETEPVKKNVNCTNNVEKTQESNHSAGSDDAEENKIEQTFSQQPNEKKKDAETEKTDETKQLNCDTKQTRSKENIKSKDLEIKITDKTDKEDSRKDSTNSCEEQCDVDNNSDKQKDVRKKKDVESENNTKSDSLTVSSDCEKKIEAKNDCSDDDQIPKDTEKTDNTEKSDKLSSTKPNSEEDQESPAKESLEVKKKTSVAKKSPKPRKKLFTVGKGKRKAKKSLETTVHSDNSDNENLQSKLESIEAENKQEQNNQSSKTNKKAKDTNKSESKPAPIAGRKRRGSQIVKEKDSDDDQGSEKKCEEEEEEEEVGSKKRKIKGKRPPNKSLRKSIEEKRNGKSSSEDETLSENNDKKNAKKPSPKNIKAGRKKGKVSDKKETTSPAEPVKTKKEDKESENEEEDPEQTSKKKKSGKATGPNSRKYFGIDLNVDLNESGRSKRQSSRLAQLKIREQSESKLVDECVKKPDKSDKKSKKKKDEEEDKKKGSGKKKNKNKKKSDDDEDFQEEDVTDKKKGKRRRKKEDPVRAFHKRDPWKYESSSGSSSENEEEEDHFDIVEEEEEAPAVLKSDHEFSPESDIEGDEEWKPVRHARTAQKREVKPEVEGEKKDYDDFACEKCGKKDHPEWILLCDTCDQGWHASCLRPSLMIVPEGDWHCPPCQHTVLVKKLQETLHIYDRDTKKRENEELRKKRLAYVGISLDNVLPANQQSQHPRERGRDEEGESGSSDSSGSRSGSDSESEYSDEPVYQLRQRRQGTTSYRFNEYDDLINSAIQDEVGIPIAPLQAAPEIPVSTDGQVLNQEKTENNTELNGTAENREKPPVVSKPVKADKPKKKEKTESGDESSSSEESSEDEGEEEFPSVVPRRNNVPSSRPGKRKPRKLNSLDDPSDDDDDDEDFKGSSSDEEEEDDDSDGSDDSAIGRRGRSKRGHREPVRRSSRARKSRFDKDFICDDSEESDAPRRKKKKKLWSESESESDDSTWGRRKKKKSFNSSNRRKSKNKKFVIDDELSDPERPKVPKQKRQRKIKYGGLDELDVEDLPSRRTRGRKINYSEVIGSESEEEIQKVQKKKPIIEDDEFVAEKEEEKEESDEDSEDDVEEEEGSSEEEDDDDEKVDKEPVKKEEVKPQKPPVAEQKPVIPEPKVVKSQPIPIPSAPALKRDMIPINISDHKPVVFPQASPLKPSPPFNNLSKEKTPTMRRGRPPKAMIAPPPERLITEDDQYKAVVSKIATAGHTEHSTLKVVNVNELKHFPESGLQPVTPIKVQNSSFDPKLLKRNPPIKIRSGVAVNAGRQSPNLHSPTGEQHSFFPIKSPPADDQSPLQRMRPDFPPPVNARKSINPPMNVNIKTENIDDDIDDEDLMEEIEAEEEDEDESEDEVLEEGEIPKKVAKKMERMERKLEEKRQERLKAKAQQGVGSASTSPARGAEAKPPTTQPTQPLLRVVSPLKLMANPPGPLQSSFMNPGMNPRMPMGSPPMGRMGVRPPGGMMPAAGMEDGSAKRRGRGRGKKGEVSEPEMSPGGGSVIQGMLQQPQSYPPQHFPPQRYPPPPHSHPRLPFPPQRMMRPPYHAAHHPMDPSPSGGGQVNVKQEPVSHPPPPQAPPHPNAPPFHPSHRFDPRQPQPNYPPSKPAQYFPPPVHYGNYPQPSIPPREEPPPPPPQNYPVPQQYSEEYEAEEATPEPAPAKEEGESGEFGGLVSYFSSQREDDIDT